jgi:putative membrane protein
MLLATFTSALFLVSYIAYHHFHGDSKFLAQGWIRPVYFTILISHILLSVVQVPLILTTLYLAYSKNFVKHKKIAKITFPIWLYVSVTGVLIFIILKWFNENL